MKTRIAVIAACLIVAACSANAQQTITKTMMHNGVTRSYIVYIPRIYTGTSKVPLFFNFHGFGMSAWDQMNYCNFRPAADTAGFILVHPQGTLFYGVTHWNVGGWTLGSSADDVGFTSAMIDTLASLYSIDLKRVYCAGFSNGGFFSFELACRIGNKIAAIGSTGGSMTPETYANCNPAHPTPVIQIHGTSDATVHYNGETWSKPIDQVLSYWTNFNRTDRVPDQSNIPDSNTSDGSTVEHYVYNNGNKCTSVEHFKVISGGHTWPGSAGGANMDINASGVIWNFVSKFDINGLMGCSTSGIDSSTVEFPEVEAFPNPTLGIITIRNTFPKNTEYVIMSSMGQILNRGVINSINNRINLSLFPSNIYFIKIGQQYLKIIKYD
jgi:polyhydroxybutyrate depolymerase